MILTLRQFIRDLNDCNPNMEAEVLFKPGRTFTRKTGKVVSISDGTRKYNRVYTRHPMQIIIELED